MNGAKDISESWDGLKEIIEYLVGIFGPQGTFLLIIIFWITSTCWKVYNEYKKNKEINQVLEEKERTIQRIAKQEREFRILFFKEKFKWTDEQVERFIMKADFYDGPEAIKALEE